MRMFATIEGPPRRPARRWAFDALIAAAAAASVVPATLHLYSRLPGPLTTVLVLAAVPLLVRRTWPLAVFGCVVAASLATGLWDAFAPVNAAAMLVALYTVAVLRPRRDALACAAVLEAVTVGAVIWIAGPAWWYDAIFVSGLIAAALGLGLYVATRRAYLAELHDRAERLERERDQQVALAATAERARIAREMHDIVAHHLTVMVTLSDAAIAASAASPDRAAEVMRSVSATGRRALGDTRRLLGVLRRDPGHVPGEALQPLPGLAQLDSLIDQVRSAGLATTLETRGSASGEMSAGVQLTVYRLVQEALTNALKHGGPGTRAFVRLHHLPGELRVAVDDDGAGAAAAAPAGAGAGLAGMRERVEAYGGEVQAGPRGPGGWNVSARLRLDDRETS